MYQKMRFTYCKILQTIENLVNINIVTNKNDSDYFITPSMNKRIMLKESKCICIYIYNAHTNPMFVCMH